MENTENTDESIVVPHSDELAQLKTEPGDPLVTEPESAELKETEEVLELIVEDKGIQTSECTELPKSTSAELEDKKKFFCCSRCHLAFSSPYHVRQHQLNECLVNESSSRPSRSSLQCRYCENAFDTLKSFRLHFFSCWRYKKKQRALKNAQSLLRSGKSLGDGTASIRTIVGKNGPVLRVRHSMNTKGSPSKRNCSKCGVLFKNIVHEITHKKLYCHKPPYICKKCNRKFENVYKYVTHIKRKTSCIRDNCSNKGENVDKSAEECQFKYPMPVKRQAGRKIAAPEMIIYRTNEGFKCPRCDVRFSFPSALKKHLEKSKLCREVHKSSALSTMVCRTCGKSFRSEMIWKSHIKLHPQIPDSTFSSNEEEYPYKCQCCLVSFKERHHLLRHQRRRKHNTLSFQQCTCPFCNREFRYLQSRNLHLRHHKDVEAEVSKFLESTTCSVCSRIFISKEATKEHESRVHPLQDPGKVDQADDIPVENGNVCEEKLNDLVKPDVVKRSISTFKLKPKPFYKRYPKRFPKFQCWHCKKEFMNRHLRDLHLRSHPRAVSCKYCTKSFKSFPYLKRHLQMYHREMLDFKCILCNRCFLTRKGAELHRMQDHPESPLDSILDLSKEVKNGPSPILSFSDTSSLVSTSTNGVHTVQKPKDMNLDSHFGSPVVKRGTRSSSKFSLSSNYKCSICLGEYRTVSEFVSHRLNHFNTDTMDPSEISDINPYSCEVCFRAFTHHHRVQAHLLWHLRAEQTPKLNLKALDVPSLSPPPEKSENTSYVDKSGTGFPCSICGKVFSSQKGCLIHFKRVGHSPFDAVYNSSFKADTEFDSLSSYQPSSLQEDVSFTLGFSDLTCKACFAKFDSKEKLKEHEKSHRAIFYSCDTCDVIFSSRTDLRDHKEKVHCFTKPLYCSYCSASLHNIQIVEEHMFMHMKEESNQIVMLKNLERQTKHIEAAINKHHLDSASKDSIHKCPDCPKSFRFYIHLLEHAISHRPFECPICFKSEVTLPGFRLHPCTYPDGTYATGYKRRKGSIYKKIVQNNLHSRMDSKGEELFENDSFSENLDDDNILYALREKFSELLFLLVNDSDLMAQLGWGRRLIDNVLEDVLEKMGQHPLYIADCPNDLNRLRKNIEALLHITIKDSILDSIDGENRLVEDTVTDILNLFVNEISDKSGEDISYG